MMKQEPIPEKIMHRCRISEERSFHLDPYIDSDRYWFSLTTSCLTTGGHLTHNDILLLRNLCNDVLGESVT